MQNMLKAVLLGSLLLVAGFGSALLIHEGATAEQDSPARKTEILVTVNQYQWWLARWRDNEIVCAIGIEHEGNPTNLEVLTQCGEEVYSEWLATSACQLDPGESPSACPGLYLFLAGSRAAEKKVIIELPVPVIWLSLIGCSPTLEFNGCRDIPTLVLEAEEPLPNERITTVHLVIDGAPLECTSSRCELPLRPTSRNGSEFEFWAKSSFGDESEHFTARIRVVDAGVPTEPGEGRWLVDIISSQWLGEAFSSCAATWEAFPPIGTLPHWLTTPEDHTGLASDTPFVYLAAELIRSGAIDASSCVNSGLLANGAASQCGVEAARSIVNDWQDQFDRTIFEVALANNIPAQLLKNLFAQESQFWPALENQREYGLGQLTSQGADTPFLWNLEFFDQFCPLVLHADTCAQGYLKIGEENQALLRGALASQTDANCPNCPLGIDLAHAQSTVNVFAQTLLGHCSQVAFIVSDITGEMPGEVSSYEDLWRYTLSSYNAGPHCLAVALNSAWAQRSLNWTSVSSRFTLGCRGAIDYVARITSDRLENDADFLPTLAVSPTPFRTQSPDQGPTPTPIPGQATPTPGATPIGGGYPPPGPTVNPYP